MVHSIAKENAARDPIGGFFDKAVGSSFDKPVCWSFGKTVGSSDKPVGLVNTVNFMIGFAVLQDHGEPLALGVGVIPEVKEQNQEHHSIETDDV